MDSLDSILDGTLDDLADLPEFKPYPIGTHKVTIHWGQKDINKKPAVELKFKGLETLELANKEVTETNKPIAAGDETNVLFIFRNNDGGKNEIAEGKFKELMVTLKEKFGGNNPKEIMEKSEGAECIVTTGIKENKKNDPPTYNTNVINLSVA